VIAVNLKENGGGNLTGTMTKMMKNRNTARCSDQQRY
jgi:hypothetical protein